MGHSSKSAARILEMSPATERVHRHKIYSKRGVPGHLELFRPFYDGQAKVGLD